jgi:hypothetical protein
MRQIKDFPDYSVTDDGRVFSHKGRTIKEKKPTLREGYLDVQLWRDGKCTTRGVHRLVAEAFVPNRRNLPWVCHRDDDKTNNHYTNLFWGTPKDNTADMIKKGRKAILKGKLNGMFKGKVMTPNGTYNSVEDAAQAYGIKTNTMYARLYQQPSKYYFIE